MQKAHSASNNDYWKNYPLTDTPIIAETLNRIETNIDVIDDRVVAFDTSKANESDLLTCLSGVTFNDQTGVFTFSFKNGTTTTVDLNIEKIPVSFSMDANGVITMTTADGTTFTADVSSLIKTYTFSDSSIVDFTTTTDASGNKTVTATIIDGSITAQKLQPNFLADCQAEVTAATGQAQTSEAWAKGTKGGVPVSSGDAQYENNAKYYSDTSKTNCEDAEAYAKGTRNGSAIPSTDPAYHNNAKYYAEQAAPSIANCTDTVISSPADNQVLTYESATQKWKNASVPAPAMAINDLSDVMITSASNGQVLTKTSNGWENKTPATYVSGTIISGNTSVTISDASITTSSLIDIYWEDAVITPASVTVATGSVTITLDTAVSSNQNVKIKVTNI